MNNDMAVVLLIELSAVLQAARLKCARQAFLAYQSFCTKQERASCQVLSWVVICWTMNGKMALSDGMLTLKRTGCTKLQAVEQEQMSWHQEQAPIL